MRPSSVELVMRREHRSIDRMFSEVIQRAADGISDAPALPEDLRRHLTRHLATCRTPAFSHATVRAGSQLAHIHRNDLDDMDELLSELRAPLSGPTKKRLIIRLHHAFRRHLEYEEAVLLPALRTKFGGEAMAKLSLEILAESPEESAELDLRGPLPAGS